MVASFRCRITNTRRSVDSEADIKPTRPQGLVAGARELEEIVPQHADRTEGDRNEDREHRFFHRRVATSKSDSPFNVLKQVTATLRRVAVSRLPNADPKRIETSP